MGIFKRGTRNVVRSPIRLVIIVALLSVCLMLVAAMIALNAGVQARIVEVNGQIGTDIIITSGQGPALTEQQIATAQQTPGIVRSDKQIYLPSFELPGEQLQLPNTQGGSSYYVWLGISYTTPLKGRLNLPARLTSGRSFTVSDLNANVALMSETMAQANHLRPGSTFTSNGTSLSLIGLYTTGVVFGDLSVVLPLQTAERVLHANTTILIVYAHSTAEVPVLTRALHARLGNNVSINTHEDEFHNTLQSLASLQSASAIVSLTAIVTAILIVLFTVFLMLRERTQEIGLLKAIGAFNWQVICQFMVELFDMSALAAIIAALLLLVPGQPIAHLAEVPSAFVTSHSSASAPAIAPEQFTVTLTPLTMIILLGGCMLLTAFASILPVWYVARLKPAQVLSAD